MTRLEAYKEMLNGNKITHISFSRYEYLYMFYAQIKDEKGYDFSNGWRDRKGGIWEEGWSLFDLTQEDK